MTRLTLSRVARDFANGSVRALSAASLVVDDGEFLAIEGPSGSGKSTLLNVIGMLDRPSAGSYAIDGVETAGLTDRDRAELRSATFAFVFQSFHLFERRPVLDSVELGMLYRAIPAGERRERARRALVSLGIGPLQNTVARRLSGGERQRVALARAIASDVPIVLADEPTGNLDLANTSTVMELLSNLHRRGVTVVVVTHDPEVAALASRRIRVQDGAVISDTGAQLANGKLALSSARSAIRESNGRASRATVRDVLRDAALSLRSRVGKTIGLTAAVALAVGLTIATIGLGSTASAQVSGTFDAHTSRDVTLRWQPEDLAALSATERDGMAQRLGSIRGVEAAGVISDHGETVVRVGTGRPGKLATAYSMTQDLPRAGRLSVTWLEPRKPMRARSVLIGEALAKSLDLAPLSARPVVMVAGTEFDVAGLLSTSSRVDRLPSSVILLRADSAVLAPASTESALLFTAIGAAQQVARQAPTAANPYSPESLRVQSPPDPRTLRNQVENELSTTLFVLSLVALLAACVGLANAMVLAVLERRQEFGLRRAVGARPVHLFSLVVAESALIGAIGGLVGLLSGLVGLLGVTIVNHWAPVIAPTLIPTALVGGVLIGAASGVIAAIRAARIQPGEALRS